ncbi:MAG: CcmD family protein [Chloroflexota bacterium]|nr:MAG: CcmD family protein [Chloroflexota bacterium]
MEELLKDILREVRNLSYLFFAFGVLWMLLFLYIWSLARRERNLRREVDELKKGRAGEQSDDDE